ncbi:hypothetical protein RPMA_08155 [Tardiphaga alba]|uniref:GcrA cell cycle regulator n=1 Tax=Tardiphaga alba TaxID=340268 RepID=A0ABX8A823_9BRAD|nr:hypothetical protein [Tardiphaga alba]QUS38809.1 hypothetical protein RPMA_08155 [Tardiphaga alba]
MPRLITRKWSDDDIARLIILAEQGSSLMRAASALNRNTASVQKKARQLGKSFPGVRETRAELRAINVQGE